MSLSFICSNCKRKYVYKKSYDKHRIKCKNVSHDSCSWADIFCFEDDFWQEKENTDLSYDDLNSQSLYSATYLISLDNFGRNHKRDLKILHLNINSIFSKIDSFHDILDKNNFDVLFLNETKLNESILNQNQLNFSFRLKKKWDILSLNISFT